MVTYTTSDKVAELLQVELFDTNSTPTKAQVERIIERKEGFIETRTTHAWKEVTVPKPEYVNPSTAYISGVGMKFNLNHRSIQGVTKIERWDGSEWYDFVASGTEGRNADYWVNETDGYVYLNTRTVFPDGVRITYSYGETTVAPDIEDATTMLAAADVLTKYDGLVNFVEDGGTNTMSKDDKVTKWREEAKSIIDEHNEFVSFNG